MSTTTIHSTKQVHVDVVQQALRAIGGPSRFAVFTYLIREGEACIDDVAALLTVTSAAACQHLKALEECGIVYRKRIGRNVHYRLNEENSAVCSLKRIFDI